MLGDHGRPTAAPPGSLRHFAMLEALIAGSAPHETEFYALTALTPSTVFLDVGANIGNSAISAFKVNPSLRIISVEANLSLEPYLQRASKYINANGGQHEYHLVGLGSRDERLTLFVPKIDDWYVIGESSLDPDHFRNEVVSRRLSGYSGHGKWSLESGQVHVRRGDALVRELTLAASPLFIKIDVEGFEDSVVEGLGETIQAARPGFMVEISEDRQPNRALLGFGYEPHVFDAESGAFHHGFGATDLNAFYFYGET